MWISPIKALDATTKKMERLALERNIITQNSQESDKPLHIGNPKLDLFSNFIIRNQVSSLFIIKRKWIDSELENDAAHYATGIEMKSDMEHPKVGFGTCYEAQGDHFDPLRPYFFGLNPPRQWGVVVVGKKERWPWWPSQAGTQCMHSRLRRARGARSPGNAILIVLDSGETSWTWYTLMYYDILKLVCLCLSEHAGYTSNIRNSKDGEHKWSLWGHWSRSGSSRQVSIDMGTPNHWGFSHWL